MEPFVVFGGCVVLMALAVFIQLQLQKKRTQAMEAVAASLNFTFAAEEASVWRSLVRLPLFSLGRGQSATNVMRGVANDIDLTIMDFRYTTGSGKNRCHHDQTVMVFQSPLLTLPTFVLRPEHVFHKIGQMFGYQDIDFSSRPGFSKRYLLRCEDENAIRSLFQTPVLDYYEGHEGLSTEGSGNTFVFFRANKRVAPEAITEFMKDGIAVFGAMSTLVSDGN